LLKFRVLLKGLWFFLMTSYTMAQTGHYLTGVNLYLSVGDSTDLWLNGQKLASQDPILSASRGYVTLRLEGDQLCLFQKKNLLALRIENGIEDHTVQDEKDKVGIAYVFELEFSDGKKTTVTSNEAAQHQVYRTDSQPDSDPPGWKDPAFDDSSWMRAEGAPPSSEISKILHDPQTGKVTSYLDAFDVVALKAHHGERRLYRRRFDLDILPAPPCPQPNPTSTFTPLPKPTPRPTATKTFTAVPPPAATPTPAFTPRPRPTRTPTPIPYIRPAPTSTPRAKRKKAVLMPTDTPFIPPTETSTPVRRMKPRPTATPRFTATAVFTEEPSKPASMPETIVFVNPPVNIDVSFGDGQGNYKLEITDSQGSHLTTLYEKHVSYERETWITWDGTNDSGKLMPLGHYFALFSKDGKVLRKIALEWIKADNP